ncbi:hypothetical protein F5972_33180 [Microbispora cellulosiformans]|uniref:Uncharacterized protein n=1 Tax=Microbispora cellulosiformans TaxID=2614688 RepID=A0A5J5JSB7_9ACTN|nr:hypothetical protein [Microbispora cellulosiformans]KAA9374080.1 hypothetical protein F5972_33180 [Microbispora cellulosiformans]
MAKLDGMDPKLVRELLSQVQHAANQMGTIEARVTQLARNAGVSVHVTHRPSQVADACSTLVKDVTGRLELLEKKEKQSTGKAPTVDGAAYTQEKDITAPADDPAPKSDSHGDKADHKADHKTEHKADHKADHKPAAKHGTAAGGAESTATQPGDKQVHEKEHPVRTSPPGHGSGDSGGSAKGESSHQVHSASDGAHRSAAEGSGSAGAKPAEKTHGTATGELPQMRPAQDAAQVVHPVRPVDVTDTGDSGLGEPAGVGQTQGQGHAQGVPEASKPVTEQPAGVGQTQDHGQGTPEGSKAAGEQPAGVGQTQGQGHAQGVPEASKPVTEQPVGVRDDSQIIDTPGKDHPDDIDQRAGRQEMTVDGVRVVATPLNQPDAGSAATHAQQTANGTGPHPNGAPGYVNPLEPSNQTANQASHTGLAPGDPEGDYVGTPADNATEDPYAAGAATSVPGTPDSHGAVSTHTASTGQTANQASHTGLAPGDPEGDYVGTPADNATEDPYAAGTATSVPGTPDSHGAVSTHTASTGQPVTYNAATSYADTSYADTGSGAANGTTASLEMNRTDNGPAGPGTGTATGTAGGTGTGTGGLTDHSGTGTATGTASGTGTGTGGLADHPSTGSGHTGTGNGHTGSGHASTGSGGTHGTTSSVAMDGVERGHTGTGGAAHGTASGTGTGTGGLADHPGKGTATGGLADHPGRGSGAVTVDVTRPVDTAPSAGTSDTTHGMSCTCGAAPGGAIGGPGCTCGAMHAGAGGHGVTAGHGVTGWTGGGGQGETGGHGSANGHGNGHGTHGAGDHGTAGGRGAGDCDPADRHGAGGRGAGDHGAAGGQGWGGHGPGGGDGSGTGVTGTGRDDTGAGAREGDGSSWADPRTVASTQPGEVLTYPARHLHDDAALQMLADHHRDIAPHDMPDVRVPEGEWGEGDWAARKIQPDGPPGGVEAVDPGPPTPEN